MRKTIESLLRWGAQLLLASCVRDTFTCPDEVNSPSTLYNDLWSVLIFTIVTLCGILNTDKTKWKWNIFNPWDTMQDDFQAQTPTVWRMPKITNIAITGVSQKKRVHVAGVQDNDWHKQSELKYSFRSEYNTRHHDQKFLMKNAIQETLMPLYDLNFTFVLIFLRSIFPIKQRSK